MFAAKNYRNRYFYKKTYATLEARQISHSRRRQTLYALPGAGIPNMKIENLETVVKA